MSAEERRPLVETAPESTATTTITSLQPAVEIPSASALTEAEAARLTASIQIRLETVAASIETVLLLIERARSGAAHTALGYQSWTVYFVDQFGGALARLGKSERTPFVELLAEQGMSTRAIASIVGVSKATVSRELRAGVSDETPDHGDAVEQPKNIIIPETTSDVVFESHDTTKIVEKKITGLDGKSYTKPAPVETKPRRRSLPDAYWNALYDLEKAVERFERLHRDDRFLVNRKALLDRNARGVEDLHRRLADLVNDLNDDNKCVDCDERLIPAKGLSQCSGGCG